MNLAMNSWQFWALGSAAFAALTAIFGKIGVENVNSNLATAIRTVVILVFAFAIVAATGVLPQWKELSNRTWIFLVLSGLATGASWLCYYRALQIGEASKVAPIDKLSVIFVVLLAALFLKEPLNARVLCGAALIAAGAIVLAR
jgi:transporter family protein